VGDFNGDGNLDLVTTNYYVECDEGGCFVVESDVRVYLGHGDGTFGAAHTFAAGSAPNAVVLGDFNADGISDLAVVSGGGLRVLLGIGDGTFRSSHISYVAGSGPVSVAVEDFIGDGWPDLAAANGSVLFNDTNWPAAPGGGSSHHAGRRGMIPPALGDVSLPQPDPLPLRASPNLGTEAALPPPVAALDNPFAQTRASGFAGVTPRPMLPRSAATWLPVLDSEFPWTDGPEGLA
jgi:hypothetical protein